MDYHGLLWTVMDCHGLSWTVMDCHGLSWTVMDYLRLLKIADISYYILISYIQTDIGTCSVAIATENKSSIMSLPKTG